MYSLGNSALQSLVLGNTVGSVGTLATFFGQSASAGMEEIKARGGSDEQALLYGLTSGAAEVLAEKLPLDNLLKGGDAVHFTMKSFLGNTLKQAGMEGTEELATSFANEMADRWIMGDKSNFQANVQQYMAKGLSQEEATRKAWLDYANDAAFDFFGGMASGGASMTVQTGPATLYDNHQTRETYTPEMVAQLLELAMETEEGSRPYNLAQKYAKADKLSGGQINQLAGVYEEYTDAQEAEELTEAAREKLEAMDAEDDTVARAIAKKLTGQELNRRERRALERSAEGKKVLQDMQEGYTKRKPVIDAVRERIQENDAAVPVEEAAEADTAAEAAEDPLLEAIEAQEIAEAAMAAEEGAENAHSNPVGEADEATVGAVAKNATAEPSGISGQLEQSVKESVDTVNESVDTPVETVEETASVPDDSGAEVEPQVKSRTIEEVAGEYGVQGNEIRKLYQDGQDVEGFASAVRAAWEMGGSGIPMERVNSSPRTQGITQEQRRTAYLLGQGAARLAAQSQDTSNAKKATGGTVRRKGVVKAQSGITIDELSKTFNDRQRSAYKLLSFYAEVTGIDVVLYKGTQEQESGRFAHGEDTIYIDITAGTNGWDTTDLSAYTMMRTFAHEFVHFIEKWSAEQYNQLREVVFAQMERNGQDAEALVELAMQEQGLDFDQATREVVAEALTDILPDSQFAQTLANKHRILSEKIRERLEAFVTELKDHWKKLTGNNSREAVALKTQVGEALGYAEEVLQAFDRAAGEAVEAYQATVSEKETVQEKPEQDQTENWITKKAVEKARRDAELKEKYPGSMIFVRDGDRYEVLGIGWTNSIGWANSLESAMKKIEAVRKFKDAVLIDGDSVTVYPANKEQSTKAEKPKGQKKPKAATAKKSDFASHDVEWRIPGKKAPIAYSTKAVSDSIEVMADEYPADTIRQLMGRFRYSVEVKNVLQRYVDAGYGDQIANEWFSYDQKGGKKPQPKAETEQTAEPEKPTVAPKQEAQTITDDHFTIEATKGGTVYVTFPGKPDAAVRDALKAQGFKWSPKKKAWYAKGDPAAVADVLREVYKAEETLKAEEPVEAAAKTEEAAPVAEETEGAAPSEKLANAILADFLRKGQAVDAKALYALADKAFGGTQAQGAYDRKDAYDALELAVNKYLLEFAKDMNGDTLTAQESVRKLEGLLSLLPTQSVRTQEQQDFQQFSTPPNIAYLAAWAGNVQPGEMVLEPSAGIGGIAVFAKSWGAEVAVNELSKRRLGILERMGFDHIFNENAEQIDNVLPENIQPSLVLMNPPFSSTAGRTKSNKTSNAERHIDQALARLADGGRLVAVLGKGMNDADYRKYWDKVRKEYTIRANLSIDGSNYRKYGTTWGVQLVVIDKVGPQTGETLTGSFTDLTEVPGILEEIRNDRKTVERTGTDGGEHRERMGVPAQRDGASEAGSTGGRVGDPGKPARTAGKRSGTSHE